MPARCALRLRALADPGVPTRGAAVRARYGASDGPWFLRRNTIWLQVR